MKIHRGPTEPQDITYFICVERHCKARLATLGKLDGKLSLKYHREERHTHPPVETHDSDPRLPKFGSKGVGKPVSKRMKMMLLNQTQAALRIMKEHPDDPILHLRHGHKCQNPSWSVRIVAALKLNGPMRAGAILKWVSDVFGCDHPGYSKESSSHDDITIFCDHMNALIKSKIMVFKKSRLLKNQVFRLVEFPLDEGMLKPVPLAAKNLSECCHDIFLNIIDEVEEPYRKNLIERKIKKPRKIKSNPDNSAKTLFPEPKLPKFGLVAKRTPTDEQSKMLLNQTQAALRIMKEHPEDPILYLRHGHKCQNPSWSVRIVAALKLNGPMKAGAILKWVCDVFANDGQKSQGHDEVYNFRKGMNALFKSEIVVFDATPKDQVFRLVEFPLDEETLKPMALAAKIASEYCHDKFLNIIDEVEEVLEEINGQTVYEMDALHLWNERFANPSMAQMATAAILFQGVSKDESVSISNVKDFVQDCFLAGNMDAWTEKELITTLNCLNSLGILQGELASHGCQFCEDVALIRLLVSNMSPTELLGISPPPLNLSYEDLLILTFYILGPEQSSVHFRTATSFLSYRFFSTTSTASFHEPSFFSLIERARNDAVRDGVLRLAPHPCYILSDAMFDALDAHFKKNQDTRVLPIVTNGDGRKQTVAVQKEADAEHGMTAEMETVIMGPKEEGGKFVMVKEEVDAEYGVTAKVERETTDPAEKKRKISEIKQEADAEYEMTAEVETVIMGSKEEGGVTVVVKEEADAQYGMTAKMETEMIERKEEAGKTVEVKEEAYAEYGVKTEIMDL